MTQALAMHPRDFEVNQTWLAFRVNQRPILAEGQALDLFILQDAASMFIFGNAFAAHEDEAPSEEDVSALLHDAWAKQHVWPGELVLAGKPSRSNAFAVVARQLDIPVRSVPEAQMSFYIKDVQASLEEFLGGDAEGETGRRL